MVDTPQSPSPASFNARVASIATVILAEEGEYHVAGTYVADARNATKARLAEAERRAGTEARYEGALRTIMANLEEAATRRGRYLERRDLTDEDAPSLDVVCAMNGILRLVQSLCERLAKLERWTASATPTVGYEVTELGRRALRGDAKKRFRVDEMRLVPLPAQPSGAALPRDAEYGGHPTERLDRSAAG